MIEMLPNARCFWAPIVTSVILLAGCKSSGCTDTQTQTVVAPDTSNTTWNPTWEGPTATGPEKSQLSPTLAFTDEWLGKNATGEGFAQKLSVPLKEHFVEIFRQSPECRDVVLEQTMPRTADFSVQVFEGIDGRKGRWQWRMYRTDTGKDVGSGESTGSEDAAKAVCSTIRRDAFDSGGEVQ